MYKKLNNSIDLFCIQHMWHVQDIWLSAKVTINYMGWNIHYIILFDIIILGEGEKSSVEAGAS